MSARVRTARACLCPALAAALLLPPSPARAQSAHPSDSAASAAAPSARTDPHREIAQLAPLGAQAAHVTNLVLARDAGSVVLQDGTLWLLSPVGGRTVGAVFEGGGRFTVSPPDATEQAELQRFADTTSLDAAFTEAILLFTDSTLAQMRALAFAPAAVPSDAADHVHDLIASLTGDQPYAFADEIAGPLLNDGGGRLFLARLARRRGDPVLFEIDPTRAEAVRLLRPASRHGTNEAWAPVVQFATRVRAWGATSASDVREELDVARYTMDVQVTEAFSADLNLAVRASLALVAHDNAGPWLHFTLDPKLTGDSARWGAGTSIPFHKPSGAEVFEVEAPHRLEPGDTATLTVYYHGDLVSRFANLFFLDPGADWYPVNRQGSRAAAFDLTFHSPARYTLVSIGQRTDSSRSGNVSTTHWVATRPTPFATFNLGLFETYHEEQTDSFPVDVLYSEEAHREIRRLAAGEGVFLLEQGNKQQRVADDVTNALRLFTYLFGPCPFSHFYVAEIPYPEGVSFPGMIDFSFQTFQNTSVDGFDEYFRAHETAHQWWGNGVLPGSQRDRWLSEGLASFSALWYLQAERKRSDDYFRFLDDYRSDIQDARGDVGAITVAYRDAVRHGKAYEVMTYEKGAWVFNMLRVLMLDLRTMSDNRFIATLRDWYQTYDGVPAGPENFQRVVEQHVGAPMDWFFDEWVRGTGMPTYHVAWRSQPAADGKYVVQLRVRQEGVDSAFHMPVLVAADLGGGRTARFRVDVRGGQRDYTSPLLPAEARKVTFNDLHAVLADVKTEGW